MIASQSSLLESLEVGKIHHLLHSTGPCITLVLPPYHPGESAQPLAALLKSDLQAAAQQLEERGFRTSQMGDLLEPLKDLANDPLLLNGSQWGRAIFRSPEVFGQFELTLPVQPSLTVGGCFSIRKLVAELTVPRSFYVLALAKDSVGLFCCSRHRAESVELPRGVPATLAEAMALDRPDHDIENRSAIGGSTGDMHAIRFGTGSGRETEHAHRADYYRIVDRGLHTLFHEPGIPLLLAGVDEDIIAYRAVSTYRSLASESLRGSPNLSALTVESVAQAYSILRSEELQREVKALQDAKERTAPDRFLTDPDAILHAAFAGRVHLLYVRDRAETSGVFERGPYQSWGKEDLWNLAMVQTLVHGGKVFELPGGAGGAAILRY